MSDAMSSNNSASDLDEAPKLEIVLDQQDNTNTEMIFLTSPVHIQPLTTPAKKQKPKKSDANSSSSKKPAKELTLEERIALIRMYDLKGNSFRTLSKTFGVSVGTVHNILKRKFSYLDQYNTEVREGRKPNLDCTPFIEIHVYHWYQSMCATYKPVSRDDIILKAHELAQQIGADFVPTLEWLEDFSQRYSIICNSEPTSIEEYEGTGGKGCLEESLVPQYILTNGDCKNVLQHVLPESSENVPPAPKAKRRKVSKTKHVSNTPWNVEKEGQDVNSTTTSDVVIVKPEPVYDDSDLGLMLADYEWQPPSEAEQKVLQARRERSDKVSKLMGEYMLKGYRMMATSCPQCMTILLKDRDGHDYCVSCNDLSSDTDKDDPALNTQAARRQVEEGQHTSGGAEAVEMPTTSGGTTASGMPSRKRPASQPKASATSTSSASPSVNGASARSITPSSEPETSAVGQSFAGQSIISSIMQRSGLLSPTQSGSLHAAVDHDNSQGEVSTSTPTIAEAIEAVQRKMRWACGELDRTNSVEGCAQVCQLLKTCAETIEVLQRLQRSSRKKKKVPTATLR